ncbi:MFS general substrate transporter [Cadophora sp. DSE1049]|nr:MFS general substrate transporter [Cadophora sp. DSE1049]
MVSPVDSISPVSEDSKYHDTNGLRIEGDGQDHTRYNTSSLAFIMTILGCAFALAGSAMVPLMYLTLGSLIALDLNAVELTIWMFTCILVSQGALAPFVGPLADLCGRKPIFLTGLVVSIIGGIACASTHTAGGFIGGQVLLGIGIIVQELLAIAIVGESVPTAKRSLYAAMILCAVLPWSPGSLYASFIADTSWRWVGCVAATWNLLTFTIIAIFYHPPPRINSLGLTKREMIRRIDFVGGLLITVGLLLFLIGINGGQDHGWTSAYVLTFLILGLLMVLGFAIWEMFAPYPLFPKRIVHAPRPFFCMLYVIFAAGINFVPLVAFWPIQSIAVFQSDRHQTGINCLPIGMSILTGAILSALLLSIFKRWVTSVMTFFCVLQTVGCACLVLIDGNDIRTAFAPIVLALIGVGGVLVPNQVIITVITPDDLIASTAALTVGLRAQAQVIGLALFYNRFVSEVTKNAYDTIVPAAIELGVFSVQKIEEFVRGLTAQPIREWVSLIPALADPANVEFIRQASVACFMKSLNSLYLITIAFGVTACIASLCIGSVTEYLDNHVAVVL